MTIKKECSDTTKTCMDAPKHHRAGVPARKVLARLIWRECVIYAYYLAMDVMCGVLYVSWFGFDYTSVLSCFALE